VPPPRIPVVTPVGSAPIEDAVHDTTVLLTGPLDGTAHDNDEVEWQGGRVYLHLGARRDDPLRR
jgi:hypothetical protein